MRLGKIANFIHQIYLKNCKFCNKAQKKIANSDNWEQKNCDFSRSDTEKMQIFFQTDVKNHTILLIGHEKNQFCGGCMEKPQIKFISCRKILCFLGLQCEKLQILLIGHEKKNKSQILLIKDEKVSNFVDKKWKNHEFCDDARKRIKISLISCDVIIVFSIYQGKK